MGGRAVHRPARPELGQNGESLRVGMDAGGASGEAKAPGVVVLDIDINKSLTVSCQEKNHEWKKGRRNRGDVYRAGCYAWRDMARDGAECQTTLFEHGPC